jgi:ribosomal protein S18 acetylase RimI-like enzyme
MEAINACDFTVRPANANERSAALQMVFQHLEDREQYFKVRAALDMIDRGELDPNGLWVAIDGTGLAGCILAMAMYGGAVVWPPRCRPSLLEKAAIEDALLPQVEKWAKSCGSRVAQVMLMPEDEPESASFIRNDFRRITQLLFWRHFLDLPAEELAKPERLQYRTAAIVSETDLESLVDLTYQDSADCPELNHARGAADFLAGHRASAEYNSHLWWIAEASGQPVGVVLMNQTETDTWDMAYLGVVPSARRQGIGQELVRKALFEAKAAGMLMVTLAVDERNAAARRLYHQAGFEPFDERIVLLKVL